MSSPPYTYVCSDSVLDMLDDDREFSTSISPSVVEAYNSNMSSTDGYIPWFIDPENSEQERAPAFSNTSFENQQWDYSPESNFKDGNLAYQDTLGNLEILPSFLSNQSSGGNSIQNETYTECGRATDRFSLRLQQQALLEIAMPASTHLSKEIDEEPTITDLPPSPKRRKSSASTSSTLHSPTEDYRKGHNAIEKRYRSNLNAKILSLEQCLPIQEIPEDEMETGPPRTTKSSILTRAVQHIEFLKENTRRLAQEAEDLNKRFRALEKLALGTVVEVMEVKPDFEAEEEGVEQKVKFCPSPPPESAVERAILNSKLLARRRQKRRNS